MPAVLGVERPVVALIYRADACAAIVVLLSHGQAYFNALWISFGRFFVVRVRVVALPLGQRVLL